MRWLIGLALFLLALGTLRVVGCGDENGVPEYPRCLSDEQCDDGDPCSLDRCYISAGDRPYGWGYYGGDGYCQHWDKPCEGSWHEDCSDLEAYYCDPETGVVECTGRNDGFQGQTCCIEVGHCSSYPCTPFGCGWTCCTRIGWCIDGACLDDNGYPRDCTDRDDARPCEVGDTIGLCWKGDCVVLDCTGLSSGTRCWFGDHDAGECRSGAVGDWRCFYAEPSGGGPPGWTCRAEYHGTSDGCDCGCGVIDPDCADGTVASCDYCNLLGSCSWSWCEGIDPAQNWHCGGSGGTGGTGGMPGPPPGWTCPPEHYGPADGCHCGCGVIDPDCADGTVSSCDYCGEPGSCNSPYGCPGCIDPAQNWTCAC